jgi:hypothetical protein
MGELCNLINKVTGCDIPEVVSKDIKGRYSRIRISLYEPFTDKEFHLTGSFIGVASITGGGTCEIRLDHVHAEVINLREIKEIKSRFDKIYITSDGWGGFLTLYICQSMETIIDAEKETVFTGTLRNYSRNSQNYVRRVSETWFYKANRFKIRNTHAVNGVDIGYVPFTADLPDAASFRAYAFRLIAQDVLELTEVQLKGIGFISAVDDASATLKMMGSML